MTTSTSTRDSPTGDPSSGQMGWRGIALIAVAAAIAIAFGIGVISPLVFVAVVGLVLVGSAMVWLAVNQFDMFVLVALASRASLDALKISQDGSNPLEPTSLISLGLMGAGVLWWYASRGDPRYITPITPMRAGVVLFAVGVLISVVGSQRVVASVNDFIRILSIVAMFLILERMVRTVDDIRRVLVAIYVSAIVPLSLGLLATVFNLHAFFEEKAGIERLTSTFTQSNTYSRYLLVLLMVSMGLHRFLKGRPRLAVQVTVMMAVASLLLSGTKASQAAMLIGVLFVGFLDNKKLILGILAVAVVVVVTIPAVADPFVSAFDDGETPATIDEPGDSLSWRIFYWQRVLPYTRQNPVTGIGPGVTAKIVEGGKEPHNDFVKMIVEGGALGISSYLFMLAAIGRTVTISLRATQGRHDILRGVSVAFAASSLSLVVVSTVANVISEVPVLWYYAALGAAAIAASRIALEERSTNTDVGSP